MKEEHSFTVQLNQFEGPLELLLFLIRKHEIHIADIPIAEITQQYLEIIHSFSYEQTGDFSAVAATLLYIKSQSLLPQQNGESEDVDEAKQVLIQQLIEYQYYRKLSEFLQDRLSIPEYELIRTPYVWTIEPSFSQKNTPEIHALLASFSHLMDSLNSRSFFVVQEKITVNQKLTLLIEYTEKQKNIPFRSLLTHTASHIEIVCAFIAMLDAALQGIVTISQETAFADISMQKTAGIL